MTSVKVYCDGVMEYPAQTAAMLAPYRVNAGTREHPDWRPGTVRGPEPACRDAKPGFVALDKAGWQIHVHAIGDRATREALDNFQAAREANGARDLRHTITHLQAIDAADIARFPALGVVASMSLQWARRDGYSVDNTEGYVDDELYQRMYPAAELWRAGAIVAGGSDYPVDPLLPMVQIETAIDHTGEAVPGVYPGALSLREVVPDLLAVIRMHTINSAWQMHMERDVGLDRGRQVRRPGGPQPEPVRGPDRADLRDPGPADLPGREAGLQCRGRPLGSQRLRRKLRNCEPAPAGCCAAAS